MLEDLEAWFPKVRPGGVLAGHDYLDGTFDGTEYGVKTAVDAFFGARGITVHRTRESPPRYPSWLARAPGAEVSRVRGLVRRLRGARPERERIAALEAKIAKLRRKLASLEERRVVAQWGSAYAEGPRFRLDYDGAEIQVVAAARQRTARAQTKEPFTVAWLEDTLRPGDVLYDIGASVGSYSLIAAAFCPEARVVAIEPGFLNYGVLCSNVAVNGFGDRVVPVPLPVGARTGTSALRYWSITPGAGTHAAESRSGEGSIYEQQALTTTVDALVTEFGLPAPTLVKLDVDGLETAVLAGAAASLARPELRSLLVELPPEDEPDAITTTLTEAGFTAAVVHVRHDGSGVRYARFDRGG